MSMKKLPQDSDMNNNQCGIASIFVTMIMMVVLTLIVLGFATISRREQTNSLNTQLSSQAYYAAETGVNDAEQAVAQVLSSTANIPPKTACDPAMDSTYPSLTKTSSVIDSAHNVSYSCLLINSKLPNLQYNTISSPSQVIPLQLSSGLALNTLQIQWRASSANENDSGNTDFPALSQFCPTAANYTTLSSQATWNCGFGMLRVELVPTDPPPGSNDLSEQSLIDNEMTFYLSPNFGVVTPSTTFGYSTCLPTGSTCGVIKNDQCIDNNINTKGTYCQATITGLLAAHYTMRVQSLYKDSSLTVSDNSGSLTGGQVLVDSTGQAASVLRRIQVRFNLTTPNGLIPDEALEAGGNICKRFLVSTGGYFEDETGGVCGTASTVPPPPDNVGICDCSCIPAPPYCILPPPQTTEYAFFDDEIENISVTPPGKTVYACKLDWGDGTVQWGYLSDPYNGGINDLTNAACIPGPSDSQYHCYGNDVTFVPNTYTITLTLYYSTDYSSNGPQAEDLFSDTTPYYSYNYNLPLPPYCGTPAPT